MVFVRDLSKNGYDVALVTTDLATPSAPGSSNATPRAGRSKSPGNSAASDRPDRAVKRMFPFGFVLNILGISWYAEAAHDTHDVDAVRGIAPWCHQKPQPSVLDMIAMLRPLIIAAQLRRADLTPLMP